MFAPKFENYCLYINNNSKTYVCIILYDNSSNKN